MKYTGRDKKRTGVIVPLFSLRTEQSCGIGEFPDLVTLGKWCRKTGLRIIQVLPVNDTGTESSPYSALSAYALNPVFLRIQDLPEYCDSAANSLNELRLKYEPENRLHYHEILSAKLEILHSIFIINGYKTTGLPEFNNWVNENSWVKGYAVYKSFKQENKNCSWKDWKRYRDPDPVDIEKIWSDESTNQDGSILFHSWLQFRAEQQFARVSDQLTDMGIFLKGDIPILMNEDSADVWLCRNNFDLNLRAGAPPDMFSTLGQNWGFPIYRWDILEQDNYAWWRVRLKQAAKFYHALRIDHVLGFFRIWAIHYRNESGRLGFFKPSAYFTKQNLRDEGFDDCRIKFLSEPHIKEEDIRDLVKPSGEREKEIVFSCFKRINNEEMFLFESKISGEKDILELPVSKLIKERMIKLFGDIVFINVEGNLFAPVWDGLSASQNSCLSEEERNKIKELFTIYRYKSEKIWAVQGEKLLRFMNTETEMLICAEDLGDVPKAVPETLKKLNILGLRIPRWTRQYEKESSPYVPLKDYPFLTVISPSVHDTTSLREWWIEAEDTDKFWYSLGFNDSPPEMLDPDNIFAVLKKLSEASSLLYICPIQDFLGLSPELRPNLPRDERINVPGTYNDKNWTYRIPVKVEKLGEYDQLSRKIKDIVHHRE
jgi:4-alpha-glucanotransferase